MSARLGRDEGVVDAEEEDGDNWRVERPFSSRLADYLNLRKSIYHQTSPELLQASPTSARRFPHGQRAASPTSRTLIGRNNLLAILLVRNTSFICTTCPL